MRTTFLPCLPTRGTNVPATPAWLHEIKYDGYRLIVQRQGKTVRLFSRNGNDWRGRYPWIVEAALKNKHDQLVINGEAVVLGVDGIADFNALHSCKHSHDVQLYAFDILSLDGEDLRDWPLSLPTTTWPARSQAGPTGSSSRLSRPERSDQTYPAPPGTWATWGWCRSAAIAPIAPADRRTGSR